MTKAIRARYTLEFKEEAVRQHRFPGAPAPLGYARLDEPQRTRRQAKDEVIGWLGFDSYKWMHSILGHISPMALEQARHRQRNALSA